MPKFYVSIPVHGIHVYEVYADNEASAKSTINNGGGRLVDAESNTVADPDEDTWEVETDD